MRLLICAGGTGGGVYPALTVLKELNKLQELDLENPVNKPKVSQKNNTVLWVGGESGMESVLVKRAGIPFEGIPAAGVHGVGIRSLPGNLVKLGKGYLAAREILHRYKPDVLFFTGGYVAIPVGLAARSFRKIKPGPRILLFIPDIEPGQALKTLTYFADHVTITAEETREYLPKHKKITCSGYPVREELKNWDKNQAGNYFELSKDVPILLVFGGSTGARSINKALLDGLPKLLEKIQVLHVSGQRDWEEVNAHRKSLEHAQSSRYRVFPYLHEDMGAALAAADLVLSRAGAAVLGEYPQFELPAVLVPYPYAWRYQHTNAHYLVQRGGAVLMEDRELKDRIIPVILELISNTERLKEMTKAMASVAKPNAAHEIAGIIQELAHTRESSRM